jgi:hypothetical protein
MDLHVIPECYIDTKLVKIAAPPQARYNHQKGCSNVVKIMQEKLPDQFALGIIDRDKKILAYVEQFTVMYDVPDTLQLLKHPNKHHYLILICPAIEKWIMLNADEAGMNLTDFGLPHDFEKLRVITKTSKSEHDDPYSENFQRLFKEIRKRSPRPWMIFASWITYLKANPYTADLNVLVGETDRLTNGV